MSSSGHHCRSPSPSFRRDRAISPLTSSFPPSLPPALRDGGLGEPQVQGGQMRQDPVLADVGVLDPAQAAAAGGGAAVTAPVGGLAIRPRRFHPPPAANAGQQPGQKTYRRLRGVIRPVPGAGPRAALMSWAAMKSASLTSAGWAGLREMTHPSGRFHRCTLLCPRLTSAGSARSRSVRCRLHLAARLPRVGQDRRDRAQRPSRARAVRAGADGSASVRSLAFRHELRGRRLHMVWACRAACSPP